MNALIDIKREELVRALEEAKTRFVSADTDLKSFRFSYPAKAEEFEEWKRLRETWDQRDEELQAARDDLKDFDQGKMNSN